MSQSLELEHAIDDAIITLRSAKDCGAIDDALNDIRKQVQRGGLPTMPSRWKEWYSHAWLAGVPEEERHIVRTVLEATGRAATVIDAVKGKRLNGADKVETRACDTSGFVTRLDQAGDDILSRIFKEKLPDHLRLLEESEPELSGTRGRVLLGDALDCTFGQAMGRLNTSGMITAEGQLIEDRLQLNLSSVLMPGLDDKLGKWVVAVRNYGVFVNGKMASLRPKQPLERGTVWVNGQCPVSTPAVEALLTALEKIGCTIRHADPGSLGPLAFLNEMDVDDLHSGSYPPLALAVHESNPAHFINTHKPKQAPWDKAVGLIYEMMGLRFSFLNGQNVDPLHYGPMVVGHPDAVETVLGIMRNNPELCETLNTATPVPHFAFAA